MVNLTRSWRDIHPTVTHWRRTRMQLMNLITLIFDLILKKQCWALWWLVKPLGGEVDTLVKNVYEYYYFSPSVISLWTSITQGLSKSLNELWMVSRCLLLYCTSIENMFQKVKSKSSFEKVWSIVSNDLPLPRKRHVVNGALPISILCLTSSCL